MISVAVLTYNGRRYLSDCLSSLRAQTLDDLDVVVVDNGSTDGTEEALRAFPWVRTHRVERNVGVARGLNECLRQCPGEFVVLLNNDTVVEPDWAGRLYEAISLDESIAACDSTIVYYDEPGAVWSAGADYSIAGTVHPRTEVPSLESGAVSPTFAAVGCAAIYRRRALERVGEFDGDFFLGFEDIDWSFRARLQGYEIGTALRAKVYHKVSATIGRHSESYVYYGQRNVTSVYLKNMPGKLLAKYWPLHVVYALGGTVYYAKRDRLGAFVKAKFAVVKDLMMIVRKRRGIQARRTVGYDRIEKMLCRDWYRRKVKEIRRISGAPQP